MNQLKQSASVSVEKENATRLNEFSNEHHISYRLEIRRNGGSSPVNIWAIEEHIDSKLNVTISIPHDDYSVEWTPIDNSNIFILLRE